MTEQTPLLRALKITEDQTLYVHWIANVYTVRFDGNEGTPSQPSKKEVTFDKEYGNLLKQRGLDTHSLDGSLRRKEARRSRVEML